jgi:hypothetical protein
LLFHSSSFNSQVGIASDADSFETGVRTANIQQLSRISSLVISTLLFVIAGVAQSSAPIPFANALQARVEDSSANLDRSDVVPLSQTTNFSFQKLPDAPASRRYGEIGIGGLELSALPAPVMPVQRAPQHKFQLKKALWQSFEFLMVQHAFRVADDPSLRYSLAHGRLFHDWFASYKGYDLKRWSDGDDFIVNDIGHPLQGAVASRIYL